MTAALDAAILAVAQASAALDVAVMAMLTTTIAADAALIGALSHAVAASVALTKAIEKAGEAKEFFADLADAAERVGTSASRLDALGTVALSNAGSMEKLNTALETLQVNAQKAVDGDKNLTEAFQRNGVSMQFLRQQGGDTAVVFNELSKSHLTAADAAELMGKAGKSLLPTLHELQGQTDELANQQLDPLAKEFDAVADASAQLDKDFNKLGAEGSLELQKGLLAVKQALYDVEEWFLKTANANQQFWNTVLNPKAWQSLDSLRTAIRQGTGLEPQPIEQPAAAPNAPPATPQPLPKPLVPSGGVGGSRQWQRRQQGGRAATARTRPCRQMAPSLSQCPG